MQRTASATGIAREFKDIFELGGVPAFNQFYYYGVFVWKALYRGLYKPWHMVPVVAVGAKPNQTRQLFRLNTAKAVCAELAGLVWGEECQISVSTAGYVEQTNEDGVVTNPDPLKAFIEDVLRKNAFNEKAQELIEQGLALGGAAVKVWAEPERKGRGATSSVTPDGATPSPTGEGLESTVDSEAQARADALQAQLDEVQGKLKAAEDNAALMAQKADPRVQAVNFALRDVAEKVAAIGDAIDEIRGGTTGNGELADKLAASAAKAIKAMLEGAGWYK